MKTQEEIIRRIRQIKQEKNAVILAHYYTRPEVQDVADYLGDSLGLSQEAGKTSADIIVFCGVHFMAETASIISPQKKVLIPVPDAGCSLAEGVNGTDLATWKQRNPDGLVVSYVNTTAEVKAHTDYCCTSSNALKVVRNLPEGKKVLFGPDRNLGKYIQRVTGRDMEVWNACCCVHQPVDADMVLQALDRYPEADVLIHPEASCSHDERVLNHPRTFMYSTAGILKHAKESPKKQFVIATELGTLHQLRKDNPEKEFIPVHPGLICTEMKKITLENLLEALEKERYEVRVPQEVREQAIIPIQRMISL
ncbi:MAG TPA: quinolinate synthase NadA [Candidatus Parabacteroides intestinavium]|nr:quinolinate synthase NadA [Candidatus Parabacteroides intestinavium]